MLFSRPRAVLACLVLLAAAMAPPGAWAQQGKRSRAKAAKLAPAAQTQPTPAPPPLTPQQMPSQPPQVSYNRGLLRIAAENSTLADVLRAVRALTGAEMDIPLRAASERVFASIGPAPPRQALADLLKGSPFDYVMLGSLRDPQGLTRLILTSHQAEGSSGVTTQLPGMGKPPVAEPAPEPADEENDPNQPGEITPIRPGESRDQPQIQPGPPPMPTTLPGMAPENPAPADRKSVV